MNNYYIEYLDANGKDRETVYPAQSANAARDAFEDHYPDCEVLDCFEQEAA